ncbi:phenylalanine--tRNA ligase subunit alpha [candidate division KSB1 bacterium]
MEIIDRINKAKETFTEEIRNCSDTEAHQAIYRKYLSRKSGLIQELFKSVASSLPENKGKVGKEINDLKVMITAELEKRHQELESGADKKDSLDLSLPGRPQHIGRLHPLTIVLKEMISVFEGMGFEVATGPEIESDYYNFEALNIPEDHPAKDLQDTFYLDNGMLLRTHTSPVQIRVMEKQKPPIRIMAPGRVFRKDTPDATHTPVFYQVEGLYVDKNVTLAELKGTLLAFARALFGPNIDIRFRSGFFPFTEPSVEYDFTCVMCEGKGCSICKGTGWIEISGCGMVNPAVFEYVGIDPEVYTGFAWGMGLERIAMLKYRISDIRMFYENDLRFLNQFS